jgi:hypothetical protein
MSYIECYARRNPKGAPMNNCLDFYRQHSLITHPHQYASYFDELPADVPSLVQIVQGVLITRFGLARYGIQLHEIDDTGFGVRPIAGMVERILSIDNAPLITSRPPQKRLGVICRNFATLLVAMLRHKGIPARERVGFMTYAQGAVNYEHRVTEYWHVAQQRWVLVDPMMDAVWRSANRIHFDVLDMSSDEHLYLSGKCG